MKEYFDDSIKTKSLRKALKKSANSSRWKDSVIGYEFDALTNAKKLSNEIALGNYKMQKYQEFTIYEPKKRHITATRIRDRNVQRSICDGGLSQDISEHFIYDCCACIKDRGTDFALKRMKRHLKKYYMKYGIEGYYLKCDIHHFFPSADHNIVKREASKCIEDRKANEFVDTVIDSFDQGIGLGSQISQLVMLAALNKLDHFIKEDLRIKYYIRYMDDFILIHPDKEYLKYCLTRINEVIESLKFELNDKTQISSLKQGISFLQWKFIIHKNGFIEMKFNKRKLAKERKRLVKLLKKEAAGEIPRGVARTSLVSWLANANRGNTFHIRRKMIRFYNTKVKEIYNDQRLS